jgi:hypothetical protein
VQKQTLNDNKIEFTRTPTLFEGERHFTSALIAVTSTKALKAYFLIGHGEHPIDSEDDEYGYLKFATILRGENYIQTEPLSLLDTNHPVPSDCNLLIVAGPRTHLKSRTGNDRPVPDKAGGCFVNKLSIDHGDTGLEKILAKWGVNVSTNIITDPERHIGESDVIVASFSIIR